MTAGWALTGSIGSEGGRMPFACCCWSAIAVAGAGAGFVGSIGSELLPSRFMASGSEAGRGCDSFGLEISASTSVSALISCGALSEGFEEGCWVAAAVGSGSGCVLELLVLLGSCSGPWEAGSVVVSSVDMFATLVNVKVKVECWNVNVE